MTAYATLKDHIIRHKEIARFCAIFFACIGVSAAAYLALRHNSILDPLLNLNARLATSIWNVFGHSADVDGAVAASRDFNFEVTAECTSIVPTGILVSAVLAWPSSRREKLVGVVVGTVLLFVINQIRILTLFYVGTSFPDFLDVAHYIVWQALIVLIALGLWLLWTEKLVRTSRNQQHRG